MTSPIYSNLRAGHLPAFTITTNGGTGILQMAHEMLARINRRLATAISKPIQSDHRRFGGRGIGNAL
jgi:aspartate/tyrosine/aromatic aminotransferase